MQRKRINKTDRMNATCGNNLGKVKFFDRAKKIAHAKQNKLVHEQVLILLGEKSNLKAKSENASSEERASK